VSRTIKYKLAFGPDLTTVTLSGDVNEHVDVALRDIRTRLKGRRVTFDVGGVGVLNSVGCSSWLAHIKAFDGFDLAFVNCQYTFVTLAMLVPELVGCGRIESFFVRYYCEACDSGDYHSMLAGRAETLARGGFKAEPCPTCGSLMEAEPADQDFLQLFHDQAKSA
jgi:hypothetical protein